MKPRTLASVVLLASLVAFPAAAILAKDGGSPSPVVTDDLRLVAFDSCDEALGEFQRSALDQLGNGTVPGWAFGGHGLVVEDAEAGSAPQAGRPMAAADGEALAHSGTNSYESDADEPDLVKTDGQRLVTVSGGTLRVIDVESQSITGSVEIPGGYAHQLLLHGDRALVLSSGGQFGPLVAQRLGRSPMPHHDEYLDEVAELVLVDLTASASVIETLAVDGAYVDARQSGSVARVVLRSGPRLDFSAWDGARTQHEALSTMRGVVQRSGIVDWLPRFESRTTSSTSTGTLVDCRAVSHPKPKTGTSLLTVLSFNLTRELGTGDPVSITADGGTVYSTGSSLYIADDAVPFAASDGDGDGGRVTGREALTQIYRFDTAGEDKPVFVASGSAEGRLLNQYSLSEHDGHLRVATTVGQLWARSGEPDSESVLTVLSTDGDTLDRVGRLDGLGRGERIYSVRFAGDTGYVVTFRETDPLYELDLSDHSAPRVTGELKITGYSSYLHLVGEDRLLGVGQEATERGRTTGTHVSLFDVSDSSAPRRASQYHVPGGYSEVEHDPHAFLYWQAARLVVLPVTVGHEHEETERSHAVVLRIDGDVLREVGTVGHPDVVEDDWSYQAPVRRSLVIGDALWTVSDVGAMASGLHDLRQIAWVPFA